MRTTESQTDTTTKLARIAWLSGQDQRMTFKQLMHHVNEDSLRECYGLLDRRKATGIDEVTKEDYGKELDSNLQNLIGRMKRMGYRPGPVRRVEIPKPGKRHSTRSLGISNFEDKLVQKQFQRILNSIYEPIFLPCSYGFREGIGCHDAIKDLLNYLYKKRVDVVIDVDLEQYFDTLNHELLKELLRIKIKDKRFIRYIHRMFKAGILSKGELTVSDEGIPQGSCVSPVLSNIFAHYVIDEWFEKTVKAHCKGEVALFRYCDDLVICCEDTADASRIKTALSKRLARFCLKMNEEKTKLVQFNRNKNKRASFNFLGFTLFWGHARSGAVVPKLKTEGKRLRTKLKKVNQWAKTVRHKGDTKQIWKAFCRKLQGHIQYYGVSHNTKYVRNFLHHAKSIMYYWLNRRSQRRSYTWVKFAKFVENNPMPRPKVCHRLF